jgi:SAM-dependent methyltransferase
MERKDRIKRIWLKHPDVKDQFLDFLRTMPTSDMPEVAEALIELIEKQVSSGVPADDVNIISTMKAFWHEYVLSNPENRIRYANSIENRALNRVNAILSSIPPDYQPERILDFGCSTGRILVDLGNALDIGRDGLIGIDIADPPDTGGFCFYRSENIEEDVFPKVDFVTCLVVMHHVYEPRSALSFVKRLMKPGAYFLLREHDCFKPILREYFDLLHELWLQVFFQDGMMENAADYLPIEEWDEMFEDLGFMLVDKLERLSVNFTEYRLYRLDKV